MKRVRVFLAVDTQTRVPFGPVMLPIRGVAMLALASPLIFVCLGLSGLPVTYRVGLVAAVIMIAFTLAATTREGVWIGTWWLYRQAYRILPSAVSTGACLRASVTITSGAVIVANARPALSTGIMARRFAPYLQLPTTATLEPGVLNLTPGGARGVLMLDGPNSAVGTDPYSQWSARVIEWLLSLDCPTQIVTLISHFDGHRAQRAFDRRTEHWSRTRLLDMERHLAGAVAEQSLGLRHYVVLSPGTANSDGIPYASRLQRARRGVGVSCDEASRVLATALRLAPSLGLQAELADRDDIAQLLANTVLGGSEAAVSRTGVLHLSERYQAFLAATRLPPSLHHGAVVDALIRARVSGVASLHVLPVDAAVARKALDRRVSMQRYTAREGNVSVDNQVALADTTAMLAAIAQRELQPCRIALHIAVGRHSHDEALEDAGRLASLLSAQGFGITPVTSPGFLPGLAVAPGGAPLNRSLQLTSDDVAACLLPTLGTPFADSGDPLVGISELTGAPVYLSLWSRPNHNSIIVGSSGAGKSVATKTLLIRHVLSGASAVIIDPDSEYRRVMNGIGGEHIELGEDALNPLASGLEQPPDIAAGLVLPVLSVMAGDEKGLRDGRPIRRLPDEDQGWLYSEVAAFFRSWDRSRPEEPVMSDLVRFVDTQSAARVMTAREDDRCRIITARLRRFTQGDRAHVFDRPSTFRVGRTPVAIGLRAFAMSYAADLTPALAVVLTNVLASLGRQEGRLIVVVDEAHRVTADPDAGEVLGQLVRQARKYGAGVWMCSQRVEDFVGTDLGRTLAATAATKLILGCEEAALSDVRNVFSLHDEEAAAINPLVQGRGVLLSGNERTVVRILPGAAILALAETSPVLANPVVPTASS
jgi:hypothetical protein